MIMAKFQCEQCKAIVREEDILQEKTTDKVEFWGQIVDMPYNILKCPVCLEIDTFDLRIRAGILGYLYPR